MSKQRSRQRPPDSAPLDDEFQDEAILQDYIARLLDLQDQRGTWLEEDDLKTTARDLGLSEEDFAKVEASVAAHQKRGAKFLKYNQWDAAVQEYQQAVALDPFKPDLAYGLARAYQGRWHKTGDAADRSAAERYARRAIELDVDHEEAFKLIGELDRTPIRAATSSQTGPRESQVMLSRILLVAVMLILAVLIFGALFLVVA